MAGRARTGRLALGLGLLTLIVIPATQAQGPGRGPGHGRKGPGMDGPMAMLRHADLSEAQQDQVREILSGKREEMRGQRQTLGDARRELHEASIQGADEATLRQKAQDLGVLMGDAAVARANTHVQIQAILTDEQKQKLEQMRAEMETFRKERRERMESFRERFGLGDEMPPFGPRDD